jgi:putative Mg2+ transporter-C (MgtC) family protein
MEQWDVLITRLLLALAAGGAIGWNRGRAGKPAGIRTHMLISMGAALFVMTSVAHGSADSEGRAIQGVAAGVGFLGAGEIVHRTVAGVQKPLNLTSAAAIWVAASAGVAAGAGLWKLLVTAVVLTLLTLIVIKKVESRLGLSASQLRKQQHDEGEAQD